jgi:tetratricopeptide (TPR) repeat protein
MFAFAALTFLIAAAPATPEWESPDPEHIIDQIKAGKLDAAVLAGMCSAAMEADDLYWVLQIEELLPETSPLRNDAALLGELAAANIQQGNDGLARKELLRAIELDRANPDNHNNLGVIYRRKGLYLDAEVELRAAIALAPERPEPHYNLAIVLLRLNKVDEAIEELRIAIGVDRNYTPALRLGGFLALEKGDNQTSVNLLESYFDKMVAKDSEFTDEDATDWLEAARGNLESIEKGELELGNTTNDSTGKDTKIKVKSSQSQTEVRDEKD